jgi:regulator of protease activity HflC (stomatin/prohibitin superfamily)
VGGAGGGGGDMQPNRALVEMRTARPRSQPTKPSPDTRRRERGARSEPAEGCPSCQHEASGERQASRQEAEAAAEASEPHRMAQGLNIAARDVRCQPQAMMAASEPERAARPRTAQGGDALSLFT